jgi:hypothetical protein
VSNPKAHYDDYIMKDVVAYVDKNFRTIPEPFARAIAGDYAVRTALSIDPPSRSVIV